MSDDSEDRTASLMTPARLAQLKMGAKPVASPAAWLDQLAADAGSGHARRLVELRSQLEAQVRDRDYQPVRAALQALHESLRKLDFSLLQPKGWLARATGKGKQEAAGFIAQYEAIVRAGDDLADEVRALQKKQQTQQGGTERTLVEFDVEVRAIEKIMEQGTRWLQDMRNQLKAREAQGVADPAAAKQIEQDTARCELLVARLKLLRGTTSAAQQTVERCKPAVARRATLLAALQQLQDGEWKAWQERMGRLVEEATATGAATQGVERAKGKHEELQTGLKRADKDCSQLQKQELALADELAALHEPLRAAA